MLAVYKKELRSYLTSMIGYVFIAFILLLLGIYFTAYNLQYASPDFGSTLNAVTFLFLIITPVLTMRILSEEKKNKTDQLLLTAPVPVWKIVFGKYLSMISIYLIPVVIAGCYPFIMGRYGTVSYTTTYTAVFGFYLLGCAQIAVGLFLYQSLINRRFQNIQHYIYCYQYNSQHRGQNHIFCHLIYCQCDNHGNNQKGCKI